MIVGSKTSKTPIIVTRDEKSNLELDMVFKASQIDNYKELSYTDGKLSNITIYTDDTKTNPIFTKDFYYDSTSDSLIEIMLTRISDSIVLDKIFEYDIDGNLINIRQVKN